MLRNILLPVSGAAADGAVFALALAVARSFGAHLIGLHVRPDARSDVASLAASDGGMTAGIDTLMEQMERDADIQEKAATEGWNSFCSQNNISGTEAPGPDGVTSEWAIEVGTEADWVAEYGRTSDLIVVGRGEEKWGTDYVLMEAALMDTGKPILIAPRALSTAVAKGGGTVGIAWKNTREAGAAVRAATPFLRKAGQVIVFIVPESEEDTDRSHLRLVRMLRWHNPQVTIQALNGDTHSPAKVLLDAAMKADSVMLVMGGYGHTRLREAVFGGVTRAIMENAPLPVLMTH